MKNKTLLIITILFLAVGFAAVSTTLILNGTINVGTNEDDFDVYFSNAFLDGNQNLTIISNDKKTINYETTPLSKVGDKSILEYEVTNASTQYDANVSVTCAPNETNLYKVINTQDKEIIEARSTSYGTVTVELKKNVLETQTINFTCTITANALERESTGVGDISDDDTFVLEGTYMDSEGNAIPNANLVIYSETPHYVTTNSYGGLIVGNLESGEHEIYHVNNSLTNIKNMTKEQVISSALTAATFSTNKANIVFSNENTIGEASINVSRRFCSKALGKSWKYGYTGSEQEFVTLCDGEYKIELWGASGANSLSNAGGRGSYTSGNVSLKQNQNLYVYVGELGINKGAQVSHGVYGFNGASGGNLACYSYHQGKGGYNEYGGGSTDIRLVSGTWNNFDSLKTRIMVAAGGSAANQNQAGSHGGGINGYVGSNVSVSTQTSGGGPRSGGFGFGAIPLYDGGICGSNVVSGAGSGYYGGGTYNATGPNTGMTASGSGTSFISGHNGCNAIDESSTSGKIVHTGQPNHYSGLVFTNTKMVDGTGYSWTNVKGSQTGMPSHDGKTTMTGNVGSGFAKITFIG